ncbi:hypothetical protein NKI56_03900 [Mesorhizobium sp. M0622]|uniref:hypothetical protein n=1 Tax=unclassified Mesorhizobium TaxID=325217 RepID=UPI003338BE76
MRREKRFVGLDQFGNLRVVYTKESMLRRLSLPLDSKAIWSRDADLFGNRLPPSFNPVLIPLTELGSSACILQHPLRVKALGEKIVPFRLGEVSDETGFPPVVAARPPHELVVMCVDKDSIRQRV